MVGYGGVAALPEPYQAVSSDSVMMDLKALRDRHPDIFITPSLLEDIVETLGLADALVGWIVYRLRFLMADGLTQPFLKEFLRAPNTILTGGAPLRPDIGEKLAHGGTRLLTYGGT